MSRTYRRKEGRGPGWLDKKWYCSEWKDTLVYEDDDFQYFQFQLVVFPPESDKYKKMSAHYHSDAGTHECKEPGPRWFRNLYNTRPLRRHAEREILKYMKNEDHEPMIDTKGKRPYWT